MKTENEIKDFLKTFYKKIYDILIKEAELSLIEIKQNSISEIIISLLEQSKALIDSAKILHDKHYYLSEIIVGRSILEYIMTAYCANYNKEILEEFETSMSGGYIANKCKIENIKEKFIEQFFKDNNFFEKKSELKDIIYELYDKSSRFTHPSMFSKFYYEEEKVEEQQTFINSYCFIYLILILTFFCLTINNISKRNFKYFKEDYLLAFTILASSTIFSMPEENRKKMTNTIVETNKNSNVYCRDKKYGRKLKGLLNNIHKDGITDEQILYMQKFFYQIYCEIIKIDLAT